MENTNVKKQDRRVVKTKRAIRNAFTKLMSEKNIDSITIKDIADTADVNRKTVYNYYNGIYEIQDEIENELVASFETVVGDIDMRDNNNISIIFSRLNNLINEDIEFASHLLDARVNSLFVRKMVLSLKSLLKDKLLEQKLIVEDAVDTVVNYISSGMLGAYQSWFLSGRQQPIEQFSKDISDLVQFGTGNFRTK